MSEVERLNQAIREASPPLDRSLSDLGRRVLFPNDIPFQAAQARATTYNATIGQITDGAGHALPLTSMADALSGLSQDDLHRAMLYSPIDGIAELRQRWRDYHRQGVEDHLPSTLPLVTAGLSHGLSILADLFGGPNRALLVATPFWGNYRPMFEMRTGARVIAAPGYTDGRWNPIVFEQALSIGVAADDIGDADPVVVMLNLPSNPGGYSPDDDERRLLTESLHRMAEDRPVMVLCDEAYLGLVYDDNISRRSMFWDLQNLHPNLVPIKVDGTTKELLFFGGRVGFVTFPFAPDSPIAEALESKVKGLLRAGIGSPVATSQVLVLQALRDPRLNQQKEEARLLLARRHGALTQALEGVDREFLEPVASNSGCFCLVELTDAALAKGIDAEAVRMHLIGEEDTGIGSVGGRFLRIAFCSVAQANLAEVVRRVERGVKTLLANAS